MDDNGQLWVSSIVTEQLTLFTTPWDEGGGAQDIFIEGGDVDPLSVTAAYGSIWVTLRLGGETLQIDPTSGDQPAIKNRISTPGQPNFVTYGADYIWVIASPTTDGEQGHLYRIDHNDGSITAQYDIDDPRGLYVDENTDRVWVTHGTNSLQEFDLELSPQGDPITVGDRPDELVVLDGYVWTADRHSPDNPVGTLSKVDPDLREVETFDVGGNPAGMATDGTNLFVVDTAEADGAEGRLILVNPDDGNVLSEVALGTRPLDVMVQGSDVWVTRHDDATAGVAHITAS